MATNWARRWLELTYGPGKAEQIIGRLADQLLSEFRLERRENGFVVNAELLLNCAARAGIKSFASPQLEQLAYVTPCHGGFRLSLRLGQTGHKGYENALRYELERSTVKRWMFAHELAHTFFYSRMEDPPRKTYELNDAEEERLCQQFAAELLLPRNCLITSYNGSKDITVESLISVARQYGTPLRAAVRRLTRDLGLLRATCVLISKQVAETWEKRRSSQKPFPKNGIEFFSPREIAQPVTEEELLKNPVIHAVCASGVYHSSVGLDDYSTARPFVEGMRLDSIAPRNACLFLFHPTKPRFTERPLFNQIDH